MGRFTVVHVGDGACSILRPSDDALMTAGTTVIDCGTWRGKQNVAGQRLRSALGLDADSLSAVVISHFDIDHWGGFRHFAAMATATLPDLAIYYPAMPSPVRLGLLALVTMRAGSSGVDVLDLRRGLAPLVPAAGDIRLQPLACDVNPWVTLSGRRFRVLWPPAHLDDRLRDAVRAAVRAVGELADDLASAGHPALRRNLAVLRHCPGVPDDDISSDDDLWANFMDDRTDRDFPPGDNHPRRTLEGIGQRPPDRAGREPRMDVPDEYRPRFGKVVQQIRKANNDLSLILAAEDGSIVCYGDAGVTVLRQVQPALRAMFGRRPVEIILAPHHGTRVLPPDFLSARFCIAQTGPRHHLSWSTRHQHRHPHSDCLSTHELGTITVLER